MGLLPLRKQENMFCQWRGGVGWPRWLQAGPPARPSAGRQPVVVGVKSWLTSCLFPPAGEEAPRLRPQPNPLSQQGNNGLYGLGGGWKGSPLCSLLPPVTGTGCWEVWSPLTSPPRLVFHLVGQYCLPSQGQGKQRAQEMSLGCCWGTAELGEGTREGLLCTGSVCVCSAWGRSY